MVTKEFKLAVVQVLNGVIDNVNSSIDESEFLFTIGLITYISNQLRILALARYESSDKNNDSE